MQRKLLKPQIIELLSTPQDVLDARYCDGQDAAEILGFPYQETYRISGRVPQDMLLQLHRKIRNTSSESRIWSGVLWCLQHPLPGEVAHDLLDRKISINELGHSRQHEDVQWRMAAFYDEALLTLAKDRYCKRKYNLSEFQRVLDFNPTHIWMLSSLAHAEGSSRAKVQAFLAVVRQHSDAENLLEIHETMSDVRRQMKEQSANYVRQLKQAANFEITDEEARNLYQTQDRDICLTLIKNPHLCASVLEEMMQLRRFEGAAQVRGAAKSELHRREQKRNVLS